MNRLPLPRERHPSDRRRVEGEQRDLVVGLQRVDEGVRGAAGLLDLEEHRAGHVEHEHGRERRVRRVEGLDAARHAVVEDGEVLRGQARDVTPTR